MPPSRRHSLRRYGSGRRMPWCRMRSSAWTWRLSRAPSWRRWCVACWILDIDFAKRETFAYACEAYSRILELSDGPAEKRVLLSELEREPLPSADQVDGGEYLDVLREAVARRNGWKRILAHCTPPRRKRHADPRTA